MKFDGEAFGREIVAAVKAHIESVVSPLVERIKELENSQVKYVGAWESGKEYEKGNFVSHGGSIWHVNERTRSQPGDSCHFTLACKRGRDGRDAK